MITILHRAPRAFALGLGLTTSTLLLTNTSPFASPFRPLLCESPAAALSNKFQSFQKSSPATATTTTSQSQAHLFRQVSSGSVLGLVSGVAVSMFSKTLTVLLGLGIAGVQFLESRGLHIVPTERIQGWVKGIDVSKLINENVAFNICYGVTFALAAFAEF